MEKNGEKMRKGVYFELSDEDYKVYEELKTAIMHRYGKIRGVIGKEILRLAITNPEIIEKKEKTLEPKIRTKTKDNLLSIYQQLPAKGSFNENLIDRLIEREAGMSEPTKRAYKNIMQGHCMIIPLTHFSEKKYERGVLPQWLSGLKNGG